MPEYELVPVGKYKGQPVEVLAADKSYCDWLAGQGREPCRTVTPRAQLVAVGWRLQTGVQ